jgi:transposase
VGALERDEFLRAAWKMMVAEQVEAKRLVFVDEMGTNTSLSPTYGWSKKGQRAHCSVPRNRGKNTTVLSSMSAEGMGPSLAVEGATTSAVFEAYVEQILTPTLRRGQVVVMDNLSAHKGERVRELIEGQGCELLYLPSYSPDFNPIEQAFSKIKGLLRKGEARTREALVEAIGAAISTVTATDARGFFEHCGYRAVVQSLW